MKTRNNFEFKQRKYMPVFPLATGKPTVYIQGYPCEDDEPMSATGFHGEQINIFSEQLSRYFAFHEYVHIGIDSFIYYREGDMRKCVAPDVYVVLGVRKIPQRRSFYTWAEGAVPAAVFEFLSDSTANQDRHEKVRLYLLDMGVQEYFIHQPEREKPPEFSGWRRSALGEIVEIAPDAAGGLFSAALNLWFRWEELENDVRLLRPYLLDGTPITTSMEEHHLRVEAETVAEAESERRQAAELLAREEAERRQAAERIAAQEAEQRRTAERIAAQEAEQRQALEAEVERLRAQLPNR